MGILVFILIIAIVLFVNVKISNFKHRTKQQILRNTGISSSDINATISSGFEKMHIEKLVKDFPDFTEESIKELIQKYTDHILQKDPINEFTQNVHEKMQKDSKIEKLQQMEFRRSNINYYGNSKLKAVVIYTDNRDEYNVYLECSILENIVQVDKYQIMKGEALGF